MTVELLFIAACAAALAWLEWTNRRAPHGQPKTRRTRLTRN